MSNQPLVKPLQFIIDANIRLSVGKYLEQHNYNVLFLAGTENHALTDEQILQLAIAENRIIVTNDTDFGNLIFIDGHQAPGVILFRLKTETATSYIKKLESLLQRNNKITGYFIVISDHLLRIRQLPQ